MVTATVIVKQTYRLDLDHHEGVFLKRLLGNLTKADVQSILAKNQTHLDEYNRGPAFEYTIYGALDDVIGED